MGKPSVPEPRCPALARFLADKRRIDTSLVSLAPIFVAFVLQIIALGGAPGSTQRRAFYAVSVPAYIWWLWVILRAERKQPKENDLDYLGEVYAQAVASDEAFTNRYAIRQLEIAALWAESQEDQGAAQAELRRIIYLAKPLIHRYRPWALPDPEEYEPLKEAIRTLQLESESN